MAALPKPSWSSSRLSNDGTLLSVPEKPQLVEFSGVFRGRELTRKNRKLSSGVAPLDILLGGGIPRGRISEITGAPGSGKTTLAAMFAASATRRGEVAAWLDASGTFDPASIAAAGTELRRMLWASMRTSSGAAPGRSAIVKAAELVLEAGGFGLVVVDFGETPRAIPLSAALRIARAAERSGAAVIAIAPWRMCGTFAALGLMAQRAGAAFSRLGPGAPATFDGIAVEAMVARNKLGGTGQCIRIRALVDPAGTSFSCEPGRAQPRRGAARIATR